MDDVVTLVKSFLRNPTHVGAVAPSSSGLVAAMVDGFDWSAVRNVVEFGPGTGVFTEAIVRRLHPEAHFFAVEKSSVLAAATRRRCPGVPVIQASAADIAQLCRQQGIEQLDAVVSGLPWASFATSLQTEIIDSLFEVLVPGGAFATFAYWQGTMLPAGIRFSRMLHRRFSTVERSHTVWRNVPPAFVYRCVR